MEPTFPQFGRLPVELRLRIWRIAASRPRVVMISLYFDQFDGEYGLGCRNYRHLHSRTALALDIVNRESHREFRRVTEIQTLQGFPQYRSAGIQGDVLLILGLDWAIANVEARAAGWESLALPTRNWGNSAFMSWISAEPIVFYVGRNQPPEDTEVEDLEYDNLFEAYLRNVVSTRLTDMMYLFLNDFRIPSAWLR